MGTWVKLAVVSLIVIFVIGGILEASAKIFYPSINYRTQHQPMYCIVQEDVPHTKKDNLMDMATKAVLEWKAKLQAAELHNKALWDMRYKLVDSTSPSCDITIYFKSSVEPVDNVEAIGLFMHWTKSIEVAFGGLGDGTIYDTILHEIGHSIGLDHYFSDDDEVNLEWATGDDIAPSIMIPTAHVNPALAIITDVDIWKVQQIYGSLGFYAFSPAFPPKPPPTPIPIPIPTPKPPIVPVFPFDSIGITHEIIEVAKYEQQFVKIIGDIKEDVFLRGVPVYLIVKHPDDSFQTLKILTTKKGHFETTLVFDGDSARGTYKVEASYLEHHDREMDFTFRVVDKGTVANLKELITFDKSKTKNTIDELKEKLTKLEESLSGLAFEDPNLQQKVDKSWQLRWTIKQNIEKAELRWSAADYEFEKGNLRTAEDIFSDIDSNVENIENILKIISAEMSEIDEFERKMQSKVPDWIKNNAKWWSEGSIGDDDFTSGIQFMIKENIMVIPDLPEDTQMELKDEKRAMGLERDQNVPDWIKNNAGWWADGLISEDDFVGGIKWLVENGIIKV